jgi:phosphatidylglycerol:prolipoprotein diacylglycerol transferase
MPIFALTFPMIDPVLVEFGPIVIRWYALAYIAGIILGWQLMRHHINADLQWAKGQRRPTVIELDDVLVIAALGIILGGRLGHVLFYGLPYYADHPLEVFQVWRGGMAFHGGFIGTILALGIFARVKRIPVLTLYDLLAVSAPIGLFFGRIANFINQELWGHPTAVIFPRVDDLPRHPSQIYEAFAEGLVPFLILNWIARKGGFRRPGLLAGLFGILYAIARSICEIFREQDFSEKLWGPFTMGMALSLPLFLVGLWLAIRAIKRPRVGHRKA